MVRTVGCADLAPDDTAIGSAGGVRCAVHEGYAFAQVPGCVLGVGDALKGEQADVGVGVAFSALVTDMAAFDVN